MHPNFHLGYGNFQQVQNAMITLQKEQENSLKISFHVGIKSLTTFVPVGIEILPPFSTSVQPLASPQAT